MRERLTKTYWKDIDPPLTADDIRHIEVEAGGLVRQPGPASGQGGKGHKVRIFRPLTLHMPTPLVVKLLDCKAFVSLTDCDKATTNGGQKTGNFTWNGENMHLANNVGVNQHPLGLFTLQ